MCLLTGGAGAGAIAEDGEIKRFVNVVGKIGLEMAEAMTGAAELLSFAGCFVKASCLLAVEAGAEAEADAEGAPEAAAGRLAGTEARAGGAASLTTCVAE